ncbi:hypothetical protein [Legionella cincinnatiensis]|uniref:Uncharacterized protein n=1 Tax=Legionella cincinnatiensis TaxID=28085 RepID=A0A378IGJ8_9GAMM|nr:hypothetical protein [Legionella cincinnatiensis]KTC93630.1 hypothetical protein Lcin_0210 [Legionella cincinnatiensis]STX34040.1 Uncharacterised protein [Legionella cincinnatiensis]
MTKNTHHELYEGQMIITFADLEGDLSFLERSLALYKKTYRESFPKLALEENDFTLVTKDGKTCIQLPENVICVNIGDLTDKSRSNTGRQDPHNIRLVEIINNTHKVYGERMISILGNRETTKLRILNELSINSINQVFLNDVHLTPEERQNKGTARNPSLVWVDGNDKAKLFLTYLIDELNWPKESDSQKLITLFNKLTDTEKQILFIKWQFANSTGAPELWEDLALEKGFAHWEENKIVVDNQEATLEFVKYYFTNPNSPYVQYLGYCQLGAQIGSTLFTHGGIDDNSFLLPSTLEELVDADILSKIFNGNLPPRNEKGKLIARNIQELIDAENAWYTVLWTLYTHANHLAKESTLRLNYGLAELVSMGLPAARNGGATLIHGAFGNTLKEETLHKLYDSGVHEIYHGHIPAERPRIYKNTYNTNEKEVVLHRIGADTCNYRKNQAAIATTILKTPDLLTHIRIDQIDQSEKQQLRTTSLPVKNQDGTLNEKGIDSLIGTPINLSDTDKGWNIVRYSKKHQQCELFKQNGFPTFTPETKIISITTLIDLQSKELGKKEKALNEAKALADKKSKDFKKLENETSELIAQNNKEIEELTNSLNSILDLFVEGIGISARLNNENEHLMSLVNNKTEHKYFELIQNKLLPMTQKYYDYLKSQDLTSMDEIKRIRTASKIDLIEHLIQDLRDTKSSLKPSDRVTKFFITLNDGAETLKTHRDSLSRFITHVVYAARHLITTLLPSLLYLTPFIPSDNTASNAMSFWNSRGSKLHENLEEARKSMSLN